CRSRWCLSWSSFRGERGDLVRPEPGPVVIVVDDDDWSLGVSEVVHDPLQRMVVLGRGEIMLTPMHIFFDSLGLKGAIGRRALRTLRSEEHTSELQSRF